MYAMFNKWTISHLFFIGTYLACFKKYIFFACNFLSLLVLYVLIFLFSFCQSYKQALYTFVYNSITSWWTFMRNNPNMLQEILLELYLNYNFILYEQKQCIILIYMPETWLIMSNIFSVIQSDFSVTRAQKKKCL